MLSEDTPYHALTRLTRLVQRRSGCRQRLERALADRLEKLAELALEVAIETGDPIGRVLSRLVEKDAAPELVSRLLERCNRDAYQISIPLRELGLVLVQKSLEMFQQHSGGEPEESRTAGLASFTTI